MTSALEQARPRSSGHRQPSVNGRRTKIRVKSDTETDDNEEDEEDEEEDTKDVRCELELHSDLKTSDSATSHNENLQYNNVNSKSENSVKPGEIPSTHQSSNHQSSSHQSNSENDVKEKTGKESDSDEKEEEEEKDVRNVSSSRPRRSAGRSLFERNPDFALGREFAKILRQKTMKETRLIKLGKKMKEESLAATKITAAISYSSENNLMGEEEANSSESESGWKSSSFRSEQLSRLDEALSSAGWSAAISSGKNMENEVFKEATSETEYVSGIQRLVEHFNKGSLSSSPERKSNSVPNSPPKIKRTVKPTRKILDGLDFRRKVVISKVSCSECGNKFAKSKLKLHMETAHENRMEEKAEENREETEERITFTPPPAGVDDNISIADSEMSISSTGTNGSSQPRRSNPRKSKSASRSVTITPLPELNKETETSQKVISTF